MALADSTQAGTLKTGDQTIIDEAREIFQIAWDADAVNRENEQDDLRFIKLRKQWPDEVERQRMEEGRPCLVIDKLSAVGRQVVNDARQNKPTIAVKPVDSQSDPKTAEIISGLIRNIEYSSNADVAYDTGMDGAVFGGRGYWRVNMEYASDDTFDKDLVIDRIANTLSVVPDPYSQAADSSDWNVAFVVDMLTQDAYEAKYPGADAVSWEDYANMGQPWYDDDLVLVMEYWKREEVEAFALLLSNGETVKSADMVENGTPVGVDADDGITPVTVMASRPIKSHKVTQYMLSGAELLSTTEWPGKYIPIVPVYGDEFTVDGRRYFSSLIRPAKDAQRMYNFMRSTTAESIALAPRTPFIGPEEAFEGEDAAKWETANSTSWSFIGYKGNTPPQRQGYVGADMGALQEALNASDDMKAITGVYDASLGARSNETSGRAIIARQQEGDVSTFHFIDNHSRAIRHTGVIIVDLIPSVYSTERVLRVLNPDGTPERVKIGSPEQAAEYQAKIAEMEEQEAETRKDIERIFSLGVGKYDVAVEVGPSFTTQRQEANQALTDLIRAAPQYADLIGPFLLKTFDFPMVDELIEEIERRQKMAEEQAAQGPQLDPKDQAEMEFKMAELQFKQQEAIASAETERQKLEIDRIRAETEAVKVANEIRQPVDAPRVF